MVFSANAGPLGIHVVPCNDDGRLVVQGIEPGGRVDRDGRLAVGDEIVEINGFPLTNVLFNKAQEIFKEALLHKDLVLQVSMENGFWGEMKGTSIYDVRREWGQTA